MHRHNSLASILLPRATTGLITGLALGGLLLSTACLGEAESTCPIPQEADPQIATVVPPIVHTGFIDGSDTTFRAGVSANFGNITWTSADEDIAEVSPAEGCSSTGQLGLSALITARGVGETTITASSGSVERTVTVVVVEYTEAQMDTGEERYRNAQGNSPACSTCHEGGGAPDHSPLEMAGFDDAALLLASRDGQYPSTCNDASGNDCECGTDGCQVGMMGVEENPGYLLNASLTRGDFAPHEWEVTDDQGQGVVPYMRALSISNR